MEKKLVDIRESLLFLFKKENIFNLLCYLVYYIPILLVSFFGISLLGADKVNPLAILGIIVFGILVLPCELISFGYILLYQHDRALDKNAVLRNPFTCILDAFLANIKAATGMQIIYIGFYMLYIILVLASLLALIIPAVGIVITVLLAIIFTIAYFVSYVICLFKIIPNFSRDLKFVSYLNIIEAFKFTKGVKYGAGAIWVYLLTFLAAMAIMFVGIITVVVLVSLNINPLIAAVIIEILFLLSFLYSCFYGANMFGQYTYNAIEQNMNVEPETLPKEINKDKTAIIVAAVLWVVSLVFAFIGILINALLSTFIEKQEGILSTTKMKKSIASYEIAASVYMAENDTNNLSGLANDNCRKISEYFKVEEQNGCSFVTSDGVYWKIYIDGSAKISDDEKEPSKTVKVGLCPDGTFNCKRYYPEAYDIKNNVKK